ncbi:protein Niban 1a isoform X2 [Amphiprion ocellaris]|uniref:Niban apoptosis regulator 1a n=1 Tax=Amphiprion ocellaris TaxID=80972 RepID=A0A3Q1DBN3_AMPOC|nr:protein Niban 1a isoform X2 [Amphiprion ocellaris]
MAQPFKGGGAAALLLSPPLPPPLRADVSVSTCGLKLPVDPLLSSIMGISASSLLDDTKSTYIKGQAEAELKEFSPYYRKQFSVAWFSQVEDDLEQHKQKITHLLKQRAASEEGEVLYEEAVLYFDDTRKWRDRYVVVRASYCLECHDSLETFVKGVPPRHKLLPTGGIVLTTEELYMATVDKCFPDDSSMKEEFAPPLSGMPGQFPVYLRLPYRRDSYFCFRQQAKQAAFLSILSDCIRHQNQDFLKKKTCEVQAFLKAIQLYRQDKGKYEAWDMLIGSDVRVMANVVMEQLLPSLEKDMLPRLKGKKTEKKRVWFATVEAAYILVQEHLLEGLSALKEECRTAVRQQEVLIHSDMDQILNSRQQLEAKIQAKVLEPAEKLCSESVQPHLGSVLEELMKPISSGFHEGRQLSEKMMDQVCQDVLLGGQNEQLKKALANMARPNLLSCYQEIGSLQVKLQHLRERFGFSSITGVIHSAQIDLQQLTENAAYTFEQLLYKAIEDNPDNAGSAIEKAKHRVLKQYDYDSSTVRKRIFQEALVSTTLPFIKKNLAPTCKTGLQGLEHTIYADHSSFIHVENIYESILLCILDKEVTKVVKEAATLKKYNLFTDSRDLVSQSSHSSLFSPSLSTPGSPSMVLASPAKTSCEPQPPSPLVVNGLSSSPLKEELQEKENDVLQSKDSMDMTGFETPLGKAEQNDATAAVAGSQEAELPAPKIEGDTVRAAAGSSETLEAPATVKTAATPEIVIQEHAISAQTEEAEIGTVLEMQSTHILQEAESMKTDAAAATQTETSDPRNEPVSLSAEGPQPHPVSSTEEMTQCESSEVNLEAPSSDKVPECASLQSVREEEEPATVSDPNCLNVSAGSESPPSDLESTDEVSTTSDVLEDEANVRKSPMSSDDAAEEKNMTDEPPPLAQMKTVSNNVDVGKDIRPEASLTVETSVADTPTSTEPTKEETPSSPEVRPKDCIKEIRDLVVEVIEVEELVQHYPSGDAKEE